MSIKIWSAGAVALFGFHFAPASYAEQDLGNNEKCTSSTCTCVHSTCRKGDKCIIDKGTGTCESPGLSNPNALPWVIGVAGVMVLGFLLLRSRKTD